VTWLDNGEIRYAITRATIVGLADPAGEQRTDGRQDLLDRVFAVGAERLRDLVAEAGPAGHTAACGSFRE